MRIAFIINDRFCPPGIVADVVAGAGHDIVELYPHEGDTLPPEVPQSWDGLVVFGGQMSAFDDEEYPALPQLTRLIEAIHAAQVPFLGICLGAQQLSRALGGSRVKMSDAELGFAPIDITRAGQEDPLLAGMSAPPVMQVHEDSFEIPEGGELLLTGEKVTNQGFRVGPRTYGFQCHFEVTEDDLIKWVDVIEGEYAQYLNAEQTEMVRTARAERGQLLPAAQKFGSEVTRRWLAIAEQSAVDA